MQSYRPPILGNMPPVVKNLLILNVLFFIATYALQAVGIDLTEKLALYNFQSPYFKPYQLVTHMFMHGGLAHIFFNMFALVMFGKVLETVWGPKRFLIFYLVTGLGAAVTLSFVNYLSLHHLHDAMQAFLNTPTPEGLLSFVREYLPNASAGVNEFLNTYSSNPNNASNIAQASDIVQKIYELHLNVPTVGASGAVFGVLLAFGMLFPNTQLMLLFPPIPIKAKYFVLIYGLIELFAGVIPHQNDNIAHFAHLGGMLFGFLLIKYWSSKGIGKYDKF